MAVNYSAIEKLALTQSEKQKESVAAEQKKNAAAWEQKVNSAVDMAAEPVIEGMRREREQVGAQYRDLYDANAVQELVNQRQLQETMARMGLTDSGLNRTQQTALSVQHGNANAVTRLQEQQARNRIEQSLDEYMAKTAAEKVKNSADIWKQTNADLAKTAAELYQSALKNAQEQYQTRVSEANAQASASAARTAQKLADKESQTAALKKQKIALKTAFVQALKADGMKEDEANEMARLIFYDMEY